MHPALLNLLSFAARQGRWVLVAGLCIGVTVPQLASLLQPYIPQMVVVLLFLAVLRMDPANSLGSLGDLGQALVTVLVLQLVLPLFVVGIGHAWGFATGPVLVALVIMMAAPSIVSSPTVSIMMGASAITAMRLLVIGTAILPLTIVPVFWVLPDLGDPAVIFVAAIRLFLVIVATTLAALLIRKHVLPNPQPEALWALEGASVIALAIFVIGLMPALSEVLFTSPSIALFWLAVACAANFGTQVLTFIILRHFRPGESVVPTSLIAGNRNVALFLVALPPNVTAPILVFIACYQIPMYLTPLLMRRLYR